MHLQYHINSNVGFFNIAMNECQKEQKEQDFNQYDRFVNKIKARVLFTKKKTWETFQKHDEDYVISYERTFFEVHSLFNLQYWYLLSFLS